MVVIVLTWVYLSVSLVNILKKRKYIIPSFPLHCSLSETTSSKPLSVVRSNRELLDLQIHQLQRQLDNLNIQLADVVTQQHALKDGIARAEEDSASPGGVGTSGSGESVSVLRQQSSTLTLKVENLMKKIGQIEGDLAKKQKERQSAK